MTNLKTGLNQKVNVMGGKTDFLRPSHNYSA